MFVEEESLFVKEFDVIISGPLAEFLAASGKIGGLVNEQVRTMVLYNL